MGLKEPRGLVLPKVRKSKRLPRVLSQEQMKRLIGLCDLYDKALLSTIYDCALRVSEACSLKWHDISFERQQVFVYQGKGKKDRVVPISEQQLRMLQCFKKRFPSDDFVFMSHGRGVVPAVERAFRHMSQWLTSGHDYKMYKKGGKHGVMSMDIDAFLNLPSLHILPSHFVRIRHYGILSPCNREKLRSIQQQLNVPSVPKSPSYCVNF